MPQNVAIDLGDTVRFVNENAQPHTATADGGAFDTGTLNSGETAAFAFPDAAIYSYSCAFHPDMKGRITVV